MGIIRRSVDVRKVGLKPVTEEFRERVKALVESDRFNNIVFIVIVISSIAIGLETYDLDEKGLSFLNGLDQVFMTVFVLEITLRLYAMRLEFVKDPWCIFDFIVVGVALVPQAGVLAVFRVLRVLRAFRLVSRIPELKLVAESLIYSVRGLTAVAMLLTIVIYVFAVLSTVLFSGSGPEGEEYFGTLGRSLYSLFQVMTLESWSNGIVRLLMEREGWWVGVYFVIFIFMTTFTFLNMFVAIFTNTVVALESDSEDGMHTDVRRLMTKVDDLHAEVVALRGQTAQGEEQ
ncbi:MAG: ion transporter [Candidatus Poseidoniales archaeon]|nr:MAG: ion transporter [Candidatus Poseidoniales archaeon]